MSATSSVVGGVGCAGRSVSAEHHGEAGSAGRGSPLAVVVDVVRNESHGLRGHPSYADGLFQRSHR